VVLWYGVLGPKGLSRPLVDRWNGEIRAATKVPDLKARLLSEGFEIEDSGPEVFFAVLKRDVEKWRDVVKRAKVSVSS
jgi:tripartite-type tricarboxylate transporter receptor subunit TctC